MRLSLTHQFVLATAGLTVLVLIATLLLARWSFERGFAEYVIALERKRLAQVALIVGELYEEAGGWNKLRPRDFDRALRNIEQLMADGPRGDLDAERRPQVYRDSVPLRQGDASGPPPKRGNSGPPSRRGQSGPPHLRGDGGSPQESRLPPPRASDLPTGLYDNNGALIWGRGFSLVGADAEVLVQPVVVNGRTIGELRSLPRRRLESAQETDFAQQQALASVVIFAVALLLAVAMALLLARRLLAPLRSAHGALGGLARGDFAQRLDSLRHDELGELMSDIDALADTLEKNRQSRRRWIADISHELRTPVSILKGELEAIADGIRIFGPEQLESLQAEVARLTKLIEDLYELSLADLGGLRYEFVELDLSLLVEDLCRQYQRRVEAAGLAFSCDAVAGACIRGDERRLEQLLRNLIENCMAYTDAPGELLLQLRVDATEVMLSLEDSPPGVDRESCERLFEPLYRRDESRSRRSAGAGLGLAICRAVVEAHRGTISASPSTRGGLRVDVTLARVTM